MKIYKLKYNFCNSYYDKRIEGWTSKYPDIQSEYYSKEDAIYKIKCALSQGLKLEDISVQEFILLNQYNTAQSLFTWDIFNENL
jgi:hypothetical protein